LIHFKNHSITIGEVLSLDNRQAV